MVATESHGLVMTHWKNSAIRQTMPTRCRKFQNLSCVDPNSSPELTIHVMLCKRMEWRTSGTLMMVTFSVIRSWCRPTCKNLMTPTTKLEQSDICRREKSLVSSQTSTQPQLSGKLTRCVCWPLFPRRFAEVTRLGLQLVPGSSLWINWRLRLSRAPHV